MDYKSVIREKLGTTAFDRKKRAQEIAHQSVPNWEDEGQADLAAEAVIISCLGPETHGNMEVSVSQEIEGWIIDQFLTEERI